MNKIQKYLYMYVGSQHLLRYRTAVNILFHIAACEEKWLHISDPATNQISMEGRHSGPTWPKKC